MNLFTKRFRSQGRGALVAPRKARNKTSAFLLDRVFFAPPICKEKPAMRFTQTSKMFAHENFLLQSILQCLFKSRELLRLHRLCFFERERNVHRAVFFKAQVLKGQKLYFFNATITVYQIG